jgi:uncharacterized protein (DUF58 family)
MVFLVARDYLGLKERFRHVRLERTMPAVVGRDVPFRIELEITNGSRHRLVGRLRDSVPIQAIPPFQPHSIQRLPPGARMCLVSEFRVPKRGQHQFGPVWLRLEGGYAALEAQQAIPCAGSVRVLPEGFSSEQGLRQDELAAVRLLDKLTRARQQGVGTEFESLSEYRLGDDPRRIDWRTTARYRYPIVRRYQIERHRDVMIVIDCGRLMGADTERGTKLDCAVDAGLTLGRVALESGDRCGLGLFDDQVLGYLPPLSGPTSLRWLSESVYDVQSRWRESDFSVMFSALQSRQTKRSLIVVISDIVDVETSTRFRSSLATLARRHVVLFAALQTSLLRRIVGAPVNSLLDGSRKAVTFRILREREQAIHSLKRSGVQVLDVEPNQLTIPLINRFIELRQRNLL